MVDVLALPDMEEGGDGERDGEENGCSLVGSVNVQTVQN